MLFPSQTQHIVMLGLSYRYCLLQKFSGQSTRHWIGLEALWHQYGGWHCRSHGSQGVVFSSSRFRGHDHYHEFSRGSDPATSKYMADGNSGTVPSWLYQVPNHVKSHKSHRVPDSDCSRIPPPDVSIVCQISAPATIAPFCLWSALLVNFCNKQYLTLSFYAIL